MLANFTHQTHRVSYQLYFLLGTIRSLFFATLATITFLLATVKVTHAQTTTIVQKYGQLRVQGNKIVDKNGTAIQLRGMSLYWSQWIGKYYNYNTIKWLRDDWKCTVVRAAMGVNGTYDGYLVNPTAEKNKVIAVVDAAIQLGIYVIIDWHDHNAYTSRAKAQEFFADMATRYGNTPNVLYEIWNEPLNYSWASVIKPYHEAVVSSIRSKDPDNIIICGTRNWSQEVDEASLNPINGSNIAYTLHYYANSHGAGLRAKATTALKKVALFVTEYGTTDASGNGTVSETASKTWWAFLDNNKISHANWSVADIGESSAALTAGASADGGWAISQIKISGQLVRNELRAKAIDLSTTPPPPPPIATTITNGTYKIIAKSSGKSLDVKGASLADGASIIQWAYSGTANQQWIIQSLGGGLYSIKAKHSGKSLDVSSWSTADGGLVRQFNSTGANNQKWKIESVGSGYYRIISASSNKALEVNTSNSLADLVQRTYSGATNQQFSIGFLSKALSTKNPTIETRVEATTNKAGAYPNPSTAFFTVNITEPFTYVINDASGKVVETGKGNGRMSVGKMLKAGTYFLNTKTTNNKNTTKLIKN